MKYKLLSYLLIIGIVIVGCGEPVSTCQNITITKEVIKEVVKEVEVVRPCNCPECVEQEITDASQKLIFCNIRYDDLNDLYFQCLQGNNSQYMENLQKELDDCKEDVIYWENKSGRC